jgi:hypothetical protein
MITLTVRTDKPEAEVGLYKDNEQLAYISWQAHRELAETLHGKIRDLNNCNPAEMKKLRCRNMAQTCILPCQNVDALRNQSV